MSALRIHEARCDCGRCAPGHPAVRRFPRPVRVALILILTAAFWALLLWFGSAVADHLARLFH